MFSSAKTFQKVNRTFLNLFPTMFNGYKIAFMYIHSKSELSLLSWQDRNMDGMIV